MTNTELTLERIMLACERIDERLYQMNKRLDAQVEKDQKKLLKLMIEEKKAGPEQ